MTLAKAGLVQAPLYLERVPPWLYPGQFGVDGSDAMRGFRRLTQGNTYFVDGNADVVVASALSLQGSDANDGTDPEKPLVTIQEAVNRVAAHRQRGSQIVVAPAVYDEHVVTPPYSGSDDPTATLGAPYGCHIIGLGASLYGPYWTSDEADEPCLTINTPGWRVSGFRFGAPHEAAAVLLNWDVVADLNIGIFAVVDNNEFYGRFGEDNEGLYGIEFVGAPYECSIVGNRFCFFDNTGTGTAIAGLVGDNADPYRTLIEDNWFYENARHIVARLNVSLLRNNVFHADGQVTSTTTVDLRGGTRGENAVVGNHFPGSYSHAGGYWENAANPGNWNGNFAEDMAAAQVGDNGITIAVPV